ncbi:MAG: NUDIX hydrolase [Candidatus Paracaedibacteraceae bacterium]|nr:NUDIX hydrolase [Candidatus Paracaedibacteraceae bacterium]
MLHSLKPTFPQIILRKDDKILLLRRSETAKVFGGYWHLPTGKIDDGESPKQAAVRECLEEVGINADLNLEFVCYNRVPSIHNPQEAWEDVCFYFGAAVRDQNPINNEPDKFVEMGWFSVSNLPIPIIPHVKYALENSTSDQVYIECNLFD